MTDAQSMHPMGSPPLSGPVPKAVLYANDKDAWSRAVLLTLEEKGYGADELDRRQVDLTTGENFDPAYLRINTNGSVPTLVVPLEKFIGPEIESKYKPISDVAKILEFLDKSRTVFSKTRTTSEQPAPALAPATFDALSTVDVIVKLVHSDINDPELFYLSARDLSELQAKASGPQGAYLKARSGAIKNAITTTSSLPTSLSARAKTALAARTVFYDGMIKVYESADTTSETDAFTRMCNKSWGEDLRQTLETLEATIKASHIALGEERSASKGADGPNSSDADPTATTSTTSKGSNAVDDGSEHRPGAFILGEHICLADLHLFPWLAKLVELSGGAIDEGGIATLEATIGGGLVVGARVKDFWNAMLQRPSVIKVYGLASH